MTDNITKQIKITCLASVEEAITCTQESGYTICMSDTAWGGVKLLQDGWYFADRILYTAINLTGLEIHLPRESRGKYRYVVTDSWDQEQIYCIASGFFQKDCRFAIDRDKAVWQPAVMQDMSLRDLTCGAYKNKKVGLFWEPCRKNIRIRDWQYTCITGRFVPCRKRKQIHWRTEYRRPILLR